jgi:hypothetical protein
METKPPTYTRLPGRAGFFVLHRACLAEDHLLVVQTTFYLERYRRLYFRDLEGFTVERTDRAFFWGAISFLAAFFGWLIAWGQWPGFDLVDRAGWSIFWGLIATAWTVAFGWNAALGQGCTCRVRTAVQTVELPSLNRLRRAMGARQILLEHVNAAQGTVAQADTADIAQDTQTAAGGTFPTGEASMSPADRPGRPPALAGVLQPAAVQAVGATALCSGLAAAGVALDYVQTASWAVVVMLLGVLAAISAMVVQLVLGRAGRLPARSRKVALGVVGVTVLGGIAAYASIMSVLFQNLHAPPSRFEFMLGLWRLAPGENAVVDVSYVTIATLYLVVAVAAVVEWMRVDAARRAGNPVDER